MTAPQHASRASAQASVGGIGGGTGLVALAHTLGLNTPAGAILAYIAPAATIAVGSVIYYFQIQTTRFFERRDVKSARKTLEAALVSPLTSEEHKARIRANLEKLEELVIERDVGRVGLFKLQPQRTDPA